MILMILILNSHVLVACTIFNSYIKYSFANCYDQKPFSWSGTIFFAPDIIFLLKKFFYLPSAGFEFLF